jgi:arginase family enzyme
MKHTTRKIYSTLRANLGIVYADIVSLTLGGDHLITLPLLRSINRAYGPVTVIHFDSHLYAHSVCHCE